MMIKVLVAGLVGTIVGVVVMVAMIAAVGDTKGSSDVGLGSLPISTASPSAPTSEPPVSQPPTSQPPSSEPPAYAGDPALGEAVFTSTCTGCHTVDPGATSPLPAAPNLSQTALDEQGILDQIANGGAIMPAGLVSGDDASNAAAYILSLQQ